MTTDMRWYSLALCSLVALACSCTKKYVPEAFIEAVRRADSVVVLEGLPHHSYERELLEEERRSKKVQELNGYPFYEEPLTLTENDAQRLSKILGSWTTYKPFKSPAACGGFHPDYAVEWHVGSDCYRILICFIVTRLRCGDRL